MSLLAPRMGEDRESMALPTVKCSSCSAPIPLSSIGEHVCISGGPSSQHFTRAVHAGPSQSSNRAHQPRPAQIIIPPTSSRAVPQAARAPRSAGPEPSPSFRPPFAQSSSASRGASPASLKIPIHLPSPNGLSPHGKMPPSPAFGPPSPAYAGPSSSSSPTNPFFPHSYPAPTQPKGVMIHGLGLGVGAMGDEISRTQSPYPTDAPLPAGVQDPMTSAGPDAGGNAGMAGVGRRAFAAAAWGVRAGIAMANGPARPPAEAGAGPGGPHRPPMAANPPRQGPPPGHMAAPALAHPQPPNAPFARPAASTVLSPPAPPFQRAPSGSSPTAREGPVLPRVPLSGRLPTGGPTNGDSRLKPAPVSRPEQQAPPQRHQTPDSRPEPTRAQSAPKSPRRMARKDSVASVNSSISRSSSTNGESIAQLLKARAQVERSASEKSTKPFFDRYKALVGGSGSSGTSTPDGTVSPILGIGSRRASEDAVRTTARPPPAEDDYDDDLGSALPWASRDLVDEPTQSASLSRTHQRYDTSGSDSSASSSRSGRHPIRRSGGNEVVITPSQSLEGLADRATAASDRSTYPERGASLRNGGPSPEAYPERDALEQIGEESEDDEGDRVAFGILQDRLKRGPSRQRSDQQRRPAAARPGMNVSGRGIAERSYTAPVAGHDIQRSNSSSTTNTHATLQSSTTTSSRRTKLCVKCGELVGGTKRFVERDGVVLCEKDWKKMYLPSCRRCQLPIEKSAVSSSDGQLKGKWHRDCFGCTRCGEAFVEDSFYVLDGKPWCQYHYHEENGTLCSASSCRRPIEGRCMMTPSGERYHPGHLKCDYRGGASGAQTCRDSMEEYYDIGGKRYCERHANDAAGSGGSGRTGTGFLGAGSGGLRAEKRRTRLVDLPRGMVGA